MFKLKKYQENTLAKLSAFLEKAKILGSTIAFQQEQQAPGYPVTYRPIEGLETVPYFCLRLPTGGGKTLLTSHSIPIASNLFLEKDYFIVIWLVPTDIIRKQTLSVLTNVTHPNREVLENAFGNQRVRLYDIADFSKLRPQDIDNAVNIFVATFQSFRVESTDGRNVYKTNEEIADHFSRIPSAACSEEDGAEKQSFVNLLSYYHPLIVIDEAHNHQSDLSLQVLRRLSPSAIIEFTATPDRHSNVLYKVSASELKAEEMIKLPVRLIEHQSWSEAILGALQTRQHLEEVAVMESDYIRPIILFQAENADKEVNVEVVYNHLVNQEQIPPEEIAIATGTQRDLDNIQLLDPTCPIRYVITVKALKEGWDCPFAYVFCSLARVSSSKDAEQLLGRVLRMPYAKKRKQPDLNRAYAHVAISTWYEAVGKIRDNLISMGFEEPEADMQLECPALFPGGGEHTEPPPLVLEAESEPDLSHLSAEIRMNTIVTQKENGTYKVTIQKVTHDTIDEIHSKVDLVFSNRKDRTRLQAAIKHVRPAIRPKSPSESGAEFSLPFLCLDFGDGPELAEKSVFLPNGWNLLDYPATLNAFRVNSEEHVYEIDILGEKIKETILDTQQTVLEFETHWTQAELIYWLSQRICQGEISPATLVEYLRRTLTHLEEIQKAKFADLVRLRHILEKLLREQLAKYRKAAYDKGFQEVLFEQPQVATTCADIGLSFHNVIYPPKSFYSGRINFKKHFYPGAGNMNPEEAECAKWIDSHPNVEFWVRNVECHPTCSFWLPTSTDLFYPDFVVKLKDGRYAAIEYKGAIYTTTDDSKEKNLLGQLWAKASGGQCIFLMAVKDNLYQQIQDFLR